MACKYLPRYYLVPLGNTLVKPNRGICRALKFRAVCFRFTIKPCLLFFTGVCEIKKAALVGGLHITRLLRRGGCCPV